MECPATLSAIECATAGLIDVSITGDCAPAGEGCIAMSESIATRCHLPTVY